MDQIRDDGLWVLGISLVFHFFCIVYGRLLFRKPHESERNCLRFAALCSNAGFMGNPVAEGLYGLTGLALANVYLIPMRTMMWSTGIAIFSGSHDWKGTAKKVLTHPCIIAVELGVLGMLLRVELPELIMKPVSYFSSCNTAMSMLIIGMILARIEPKQFMDKTVLLFTVHRLVILPVLVFAACSLLPVSTTARNICVMVSTLLSIPTTALWSFFLMR